MAFLLSIGTEDTCGQLGIQAKHDSELVGKSFLIEQKKSSALLPIPTEPNHANYPPSITFRFFLYGTSFKVNHSFRQKGKKVVQTIEVFTVEIDRSFSYFKRTRIEALCREAISFYLGADYFGNRYEVTSKLVPEIMSKRELEKIENMRAQILQALEKHAK